MTALRVESRDLRTTEALARALAAQLGSGDALCLEGDLGAGKTTFVTALVAALGGVDAVTSPTFTLENRYRLDRGELGLMLHCDLYRPGDDARRDLLPSMLEARDQGALLAVEWAAPVEDWLRPFLRLSITVTGPASRSFALEAEPDGWPPFEELRATWNHIITGAPS
jgi:tRNA threonylcarbamoyladenosine biosynthesis protein TsaE